MEKPIKWISDKRGCSSYVSSNGRWRIFRHFCKGEPDWRVQEWAKGIEIVLYTFSFKDAKKFVQAKEEKA